MGGGCKAGSGPRIGAVHVFAIFYDELTDSRVKQACPIKALAGDYLLPEPSEIVANMAYVCHGQVSLLLGCGRDGHQSLCREFENPL